MLEGSGAREVVFKSTDDPVTQAPRLYLAALALVLAIVERFPAAVLQVCVRLGGRRRRPFLDGLPDYTAIGGYPYTPRCT